MAPGLSKKGQISATSNVSKTFASGLPRRISILDEPVPKSITSQNSASQPRGGKRELAFAKSTSLIQTQTLLGVRETVNSDPPTVVTRASSRVSGKHPNPHSPSSNNDIPSSPPPHGMSNSPTTVEATSEDDVQDGDQVTHKPKQGRGPTRGLGLHKRNRRFDKNLSVTIDPIFGRALTRNESTNFANELGQIAQAYVWPISKAGSRNEVLPLILLRLQVKLDIQNINDPAVQDKVWKHFAILVKGRRGRLHETFIKHVKKGLDPKEHKPNNISEDMWNNLCDHWNDEKVQEISEKNKTNRNLLTKPHNQGSVAFIPLFHETLKKEGSENFDWIEFFKRSRTSKSGDWMTTECQQAYEKMKAMVDSSKESDHPITPEKALQTVLGTKSGYCKGMGYGPTPPSSKRARVDSEIAYLREMNKKLSEENTKFKESQAESERRQAESERKQAESDARLAASIAQQEVFQKFMERAMAKGFGDI
ncbi:hypothetical protein LINGRAHAP2_LOCUS4782 [Linum grandiflorum]